ncbi:MAG TPA: metallophosphoesterase [Acidimicrobiales bacterium]
MRERARRRWRARAVLFGLAGAALGLWVGARQPVEIGPFDATLWLRPSIEGDTLVRLGPLGTIRVDTHDAPVAVEARIDELRVAEAERIASNPSVLGTIEEELAGDARDAVRSLALRSALAALVGGIVGGAVAAFHWRAVATGLVVAGLAAGGVGGATAATWRPEALAEPEYTGLLGVAPRAVGDAQVLIDRFGEYRAQLAELVDNLATVYQAAQGLPTFRPGDEAIRVLHVSDIHLNPQAFDLAERLIDSFAVDVVVDTGDLTDWGTPPENRFIDRIGALDIPYVYVRGNHDSAVTQAAVASQPNAVVLDGGSEVVAGVRFWGIGDPRYTPDKSAPDGPEAEAAAAAAFADEVEAAVAAEPEPPDVVLVHDARVATGLGSLVPLVLSGHTHAARQSSIGEAVLLVQGSTGGAGLRGLQGDEPEPLTASVLYLDPDTLDVLAYDAVTVAGLGGSGARIERHVLAEPATATDGPSSRP